MAVSKLPAAITKKAGIPNGMRTATIAAVTSSGVTINVAGGSFSSGVGCIDSYAPVVGDVVAVFRQDSSWVILGPTEASPKGKWVRFSTISGGGYASGWTDRGAGFPVGQYRIMGGQVYVTGQLNATSAPTNGGAVVSGLPVPPGEMIICVATVGSSTAGVPCSLHVDGTGTMRIYQVNSSNLLVAGLMQFSSLYPLDCIIG
jgi:hypothetical protein